VIKITSMAFHGLQCDLADHFWHQASYFMAFMAFGAGAAAFLAAFFIAFMALGMVTN